MSKEVRLRALSLPTQQRTHNLIEGARICSIGFQLEGLKPAHGRAEGIDQVWTPAQLRERNLERPQPLKDLLLLRLLRILQ